jgi:hypothetical protein
MWRMSLSCSTDSPLSHREREPIGVVIRYGSTALAPKLEQGVVAMCRVDVEDIIEKGSWNGALVR